MRGSVGFYVRNKGLKMDFHIYITFVCIIFAYLCGMVWYGVYTYRKSCHNIFRATNNTKYMKI